MLSKNILILLSISYLFITSCNEQLSGFSSTLPANKKPSAFFDPDLQGRYSMLDSSMVFIGFDRTIPIKFDSSIAIHISNLLTINSNNISNSLKGHIALLKKTLTDEDRLNIFHHHEIDSLIITQIPGSNYSYKIDSTLTHYIININIDNKLFEVSNYNVIKQYKNKSYLNLFNEALQSWQCIQMDYNSSSSILSINTLSANDDQLLRRLHEYYSKENVRDSLFTPTEKAFKAFLKFGGFEDRIVLKKHE